MDKEEYEYHKFLNLLVVLKNSITLICFTLLAIVFQKWWIVLFAILFTVRIDKDKPEQN